ncbi:MAG TPA: hypothetical protein VH328_14580 [Burkholderiaceae bacterium]|nr:hypothetical protein [Burkholderiaceae bacterium]
MTSQSDHQRNTRFRAPQFAMGRAQEGESPFGEPPARPAPEKIEWAPVPAEAAPDAPIVIVRRKRQLALPVESPDGSSNPDEEARSPRVFKLKRNEDSPAAGSPRPDDAGDAGLSPLSAATASEWEPAPVARAVPMRRRVTPDFRRAGPVTIARPQVEGEGEGETGIEGIGGRGNSGPPASLAQLMTQFEALNAQLSTLTAAPRRLPELDLTIDRRWDAIDEALHDLRQSLGLGGWEWTF